MELKVIREKDEWESVLSSFQKRDVFFHFDFIHSIQDVGGEGFPEAVYFNDGNSRVFYPYLRRKLNLPWIPEELKNHSDITSPFGEGGFIIEGGSGSFFKSWKQYVEKEKILTEFIRFQPFFVPTDFPFEQIHISDFVYCELETGKTDEEIFRLFRKGNKSDIHHAEKIVKVYNISADLFYSFYKSFASQRNLVRHLDIIERIKALQRLMPDSVSCKGAFMDEDLIAASMFLNEKGNFGHYFLAGINHRERGVPALLIWEAIRDARSLGCQVFSLGGGVGREDGIFHFKKGFSDLTRPYYISKIIHDDKVYQACCSAYEKHFGNKEILFPAYRKF